VLISNRIDESYEMLRRNGFDILEIFFQW